jgi:YidC/Oxa1 family membrane protein insertase
VFEFIGAFFDMIFARPIFNGLMLLYHLFGDLGLSIIVLTIIIKLVLFPLTIKQLKSSKAMQQIQPELKKLQKQYASDPQKMMQETQKLYKAAGASPMSGCLPTLVQLPVLYGLYYAVYGAFGQHGSSATQLLKAINDRLYAWVPHFTTPVNFHLDWLTFISPVLSVDLSKPSPVLAILAGLATFVSLRMSMPKQNKQADKDKKTPEDPMAQSMKMMQYIFPFMTAFFGFTFPAGLALYWTISSVFQAVQQYFVTGWGSLLIGTPKKPEVKPAVETLPASTVEANGREGSQAKSGKEVPVAAEKSSSTSTLRSNAHNATGSQRRSRNSASARRRNTQRTHR